VNPWSTLGIEPTNELIAIKRAYAVKLKQTRPDDDASAYQALRDAYEFAQQQARLTAQQSAGEIAQPTMEQGTQAAHLIVPDDFNQTPAPTAAQQAPKLETEPDFPAYIPARDLAAQTLHHLQSAGSDALVASWPLLEREFDNLPLLERTEASRWFAQLVIDAEKMPRAFASALSTYFHWDTDFRTEQVLGTPRAIALRERLHEINYGFLADEAFRQRYVEVSVFGHLAQVLAKWQLYLFAILAPSRLARLWNELAPRQRYALGVPPPPLHTRADHAMEMGGWVRTALVLMLGATVTQLKRDMAAPWTERLAVTAVLGLGGLLVVLLGYRAFLSIKRSLQSVMRPEGLAPGLPRPSFLAALGFGCMLGATLMCGIGEANAWPAAFRTGFASPMLVCITLMLIVLASLVPSLPATEASPALPAILLLCIVTGVYFPGLTHLPWTGACLGMTWFMVCSIAHTLYRDEIETLGNKPTTRNFAYFAVALARITIAWPYRLMLTAANQSARYVIAVVGISLVALPTEHRAWQLPFSIFVSVMFAVFSGFSLKQAMALTPDAKAQWKSWIGMAALLLWIVWIGVYFSVGAQIDMLFGWKPPADTTDVYIRRFGLAFCVPPLLLMWGRGFLKLEKIR
jgi:hypothetical protein